MEVKLICDCEECHSCLLELGCVNILIDIPVKLLRNFSESLKQPLTCDFDTNCELYEKLNCSDIHVILLTNSRGFEGLDLLSYFYDLNSTHIVCTRPLYVLATIYYQNYSYELEHELQNKTNGDFKGLTNKDDKFKGFHCNKLLNNLKEVKYNGGFSLTDFLNNNLLHLISYNELLKIDITTSDTNHFHVRKEVHRYNDIKGDNNSVDDGYQGNNTEGENKMDDIGKTHWNNYLNDFNVELELVAMSNGYSLGSCNYIIKHGNLSEKVVIVSKSSDHNRYTKPFNYSIFDNLNKEDVILLLSNTSSNNNNNTCSYRYPKVIRGSNLVHEVEMVDELEQQRVEENKDKTKVKEEKEVPYKQDNYNVYDNKIDVYELKNEQLFDDKDKDRKEIDNNNNHNNTMELNEEFDYLGLYCIDKIEKGNNVLIPLDFNYEYLIDLIENLNRCIKKMKKQIFVYCVGKGVEDLFDYLEKCCEWVREERSEYTMHSEDPKSPFPELDEMKINNQLFISDNVNGVANVYRVPSILILIIYNEEEMINYMNNKNNRFVILQNKYLKYIDNDSNRSNSNNKQDKDSKEIDNNNNNSCNKNYYYYKVNLEMDLSNINTNSKLVDIKKNYLNGNNSVKVELQEDRVGFVKGQMNRETYNNLRFLDLDEDLKVNLFEVNLENMDEIIMKHKNSLEGRYLERVEHEQYKVEEEKNNRDKENDEDNDNYTMELELIEDTDEDIDELILFGNYDYDKLINELKKYFNNPLIKITKQPKNSLIILSSSNLFNIIIDNENKTTVIETINNKYRKYILKSMQKLMLTL